MTQAAAPAGRQTAPGAPPRGLRVPRTADARISPTVVIGTSGETSGGIRNMGRPGSMFYNGALSIRMDVLVPEIRSSRRGDTVAAHWNGAAVCGLEQVGSAEQTAAVPALYHVSGFEYI